MLVSSPPLSVLEPESSSFLSLRGFCGTCSTVPELVTVELGPWLSLPGLLNLGLAQAETAL